MRLAFELMLAANCFPREAGPDMERLWLAHYPAGVPAEIDATRYASLVAMFEESFRLYASRAACVCMGTTLTYADSTRPRAPSPLGCRAAA